MAAQDCRDLLFVATHDPARAASALAAIDRALAAAGTAGIYRAFLFGSAGHCSVWVGCRDGSPAPYSDAWNAGAR